MFRTEQRSSVKSTAEPTEGHCISLTAVSLQKQQPRLSHAKPNKRQTERFLYVAFEVEKLAVICLNTVCDAWYFPSKMYPSECWKKFSWQVDSLPFLGCLAHTDHSASWELTWGQPYYSLTRTQAHTTNSHLLNWGHRKQITTSKWSNCRWTALKVPC